VKVFIEREQRVGLQLPKNAPEFLFYPIDGMEESAPVDSQFARAQLPVRTQKEVIPKQIMLEFGKSSPRYQAEIGNIFFVFPAPRRGPAPSLMSFERNAAHVSLLLNTTHEAVVANAENRA
jgi:hypothetical protein